MVYYAGITYVKMFYIHALKIRNQPCLPSNAKVRQAGS